MIPRTHEQREARFQAEHRIVLNVEVTDAEGNPITGLKPGDFTLIQDRQPRSIASVRPVNGEAARVPPQVLLLLDAVNNSSRDLANDRKGVESFLRQSPEPLAYPTSIAVLSDAEIRSGPLTRDRGTLLNELRDLSSGLHPIACANDVNSNEKSFRGMGLPGAGAVASSDTQLNCLNQRFVASVNALTRFARSQVDIPGRVILIWIGSGWQRC